MLSAFGQNYDDDDEDDVDNFHEDDHDYVDDYDFDLTL